MFWGWVTVNGIRIKKWAFRKIIKTVHKSLLLLHILVRFSKKIAANSHYITFGNIKMKLITKVILKSNVVSNSNVTTRGTFHPISRWGARMVFLDIKFIDRVWLIHRLLSETLLITNSMLSNKNTRFVAHFIGKSLNRHILNNILWM